MKANKLYILNLIEESESLKVKVVFVYYYGKPYQLQQEFSKHHAKILKVNLKDVEDLIEEGYIKVVKEKQGRNSVKKYIRLNSPKN